MAFHKENRAMDIYDEMVQSVTQDWLEFFESERRAGRDFATSFYWRLSRSCLPEGVNANDPRVKDALEVIKLSIAKKDGTAPSGA